MQVCIYNSFLFCILHNVIKSQGFAAAGIFIAPINKGVLADLVSNLEIHAGYCKSNPSPFSSYKLKHYSYDRQGHEYYRAS